LEVPNEEEERVCVLNVEKSIPEVDKEAIEFVKSCISGESNVKNTDEIAESMA